MHKDDFRMRLIAASYWAWRAMQRYVIDKLPPEFRYDITFRTNAGMECKKVGSILQVNDAVEKIMKKDKVPVWIDVIFLNIFINSLQVILHLEWKCAIWHQVRAFPT